MLSAEARRGFGIGSWIECRNAKPPVVLPVMCRMIAVDYALASS